MRSSSQRRNICTIRCLWPLSKPARTSISKNPSLTTSYWYRNSLEDNPWRYKVPDDASPQNSDWNKFLGHAPQRDWDARRYFQWRLYSDCSGGIPTDLLVHQTDITNFVCNRVAPLSCMASGGIYRWTAANDDRDVADTLSAIYEYPDKFHINYSCYFGNHVELSGNDNKAVEAHIHDWLEAIAGKAQVIAPTRVGQEAAISGHMAKLSLRNSKKIVWDNRARKYHFT